MKKLLILVLFFSSKIYGQTKYFKGYIIDTNNQKTECFVKRQEWLRTPKEFIYKLDINDSKEELGTLMNLNEIGIYDEITFIKAKVKIDIPTDLKQYSSRNSEPEFQERLLFLEQFVKGKSSLFGYDNDEVVRFFYKTESTPLTQLIHREYLNDAYRVAQNNKFREQIWKDLYYDELNIEDLKYINYKEKDLIKIFSNYNKFFNPQQTVKIQSLNPLWKLNLITGLDLSGVRILLNDKPLANSQLNFSPVLGIGCENFINSRTKKWSLNLNALYNKLNVVNIPSNGFDNENQVTYRNIEILLFAKRYFFISEKFTFSILFGGGRRFNLGSSFRSNTYAQSADDPNIIDNLLGITAGIGVQYKNFDLSLRYETQRERIGVFGPNYKAERLNQLNLLLAYNIKLTK
jgi:hypothetical protein